MSRKAFDGEAGFTLLEMLVGLAASVILLTVLARFFYGSECRYEFVILLESRAYRSFVRACAV